MMSASPLRPRIALRSDNATTLGCLGFLLLLELPLVELQFVALEDVSISTPGLTWARGNAGQQTSTLELILDQRVQLLLGSTSLELADDVAALLLGNGVLVLVLCVILALLLAKKHAVLLQVPLLEGLSINLHNGILQQGLCAHQLVACGVVHNIQDTHLLCAVLRTPCVVSTVQAQGSVLHVSSTAANHTDALGSELGHRRWASHFKLPLLLVNVAATAGGAMLVAGVTGNSHLEGRGVLELLLFQSVG